MSEPEQFSEAMHWYFAYGSNMLAAQMAQRTGQAEPAMVCRLPDHRLAFNKRFFRAPSDIHANIVPSPGDDVWGVAYHCTPQALQVIDLYENVLEDSYRRHEVAVQGPDGRFVRAVTYIASPSSLCNDAAPPAEYLDRILRGARQSGLPAAYIESIVCCASGASGASGQGASGQGAQTSGGHPTRAAQARTS
jgi:cation transport regulator ChaC